MNPKEKNPKQASICFDKHYKPLPDTVEIKPSSIHGHGIFCKRSMGHNKLVGVSHRRIIVPTDLAMKPVKIELIRTPLGGFINHSFTPNCTLFEKDAVTLMLVSLKPIALGEELTLNYLDHECGLEVKCNT